MLLVVVLFVLPICFVLVIVEVFFGFAVVFIIVLFW